MKHVLHSLLIVVVLFVTGLTNAQTYKGDQACMLCHNSTNPNLGYNIYAEYQKTGHPYKLNEITGNAQPTYPANTTPGYPAPAGKQFSDFKYVIGGYGWKARFVQPDGMVYIGSAAQYNLATQQWVAFNDGKPTAYNYSCFKCHTTGPVSTGSWTPSQADGFGTFAQPGIRCEGCHGPAGDHTTDPTIIPFKTGDDLEVTRCGECHQRGGATNAIPASGGFVEHHEQVNEFRASKHGDGIGTDLTCASCHDAHIALHYKNVAGTGLKAIKIKCQDCHANKTIKINGTITKSADCVDCHMSKTGKSAIGIQLTNGWKGDIPSHLMAINTNAVTKTSMFSADGKSIALDANGHAATTMDFACLGCHTDKDVAWSATYAKGIHTNGITGVEDLTSLPTEFSLSQNYPNPFNPSTTISFALPKAANVKLSIYSITGELIADLIDNMMPAGSHNVKFEMSRELATGVYIYRINAGNFTSSKKMLLLK